MTLYHSNTRHVINNCLSVISCQSYFCCSLGFQPLLKSEDSLKACFDNALVFKPKNFHFKQTEFGKNIKLKCIKMYMFFAFHSFVYVFTFHAFKQKLKPNCQKCKIKAKMTML